MRTTDAMNVVLLTSCTMLTIGCSMWMQKDHVLRKMIQRRSFCMGWNTSSGSDCIIKLGTDAGL